MPFHQLTGLPLHQYLQLTLSILSFCASIILAFINHHNSKKIEKLKATQDIQKEYLTEYFKNYLNLWVSGSQSELNSYKDVLTVLQQLKDKMKLVIGNPGGFSPRRLVGEINALAESAANAYAKNQMHFDETLTSIVHSAKNLCIALSASLAQDAGRCEKGGVLVVSAKTKELLEKISEWQNLIRDEAQRATGLFLEELKEKTGHYLTQKKMICIFRMIGMHSMPPLSG